MQSPTRDVHHAIANCGTVGEDDTVLVLGASGACGLAAIDLAKAFGARVVACASTAEKLEACKAAGADDLVNYENGGTDGFLQTLRDTGLYGQISVVFDPVGGAYAEVAFQQVATLFSGSPRVALTQRALSLSFRSICY